jgi:hypothetical protein
LNALGFQFSPIVASRSSHTKYSLVSGAIIGRVHGYLCRRQLEDEPAAASVDLGLSEHVSEERPVRFRVATL